MRILREWVHRVLGTLDPRPHDHELDEELRSHLELATDDAQRRGHPREVAMRVARIRAGGVPNGTSPGPEWFTVAGIAPDIRQSSRRRKRT
jgi:hypothetical protein